MKKFFGPGLLFAASAIGVSHLVQSTKAGAEYGWIFAVVILVANVIKFPFFEFGTRYADGTGTSLIQGYYKMGKWALWLYAIATVATMFTVTGAVSLVMSGLFANLIGETWPIQYITIVVFILCFIWLSLGKYAFLDKSIKVITALLAISTFAAFSIAMKQNGAHFEFEIPDFSSHANVVFTMALIGWMPTALDLSVWNSLWTVESKKGSGASKSWKGVLMDFHFGYWFSALAALLFLGLGAMLMRDKGISFPDNAVGFTSVLIQIYTDTLGSEFRFIIVLSAAAAMFSTTLSVFDGYGRTTLELSKLLFKSKGIGYWGAVLIVAIGGWILVTLFKSSMTDLVQFAMITSFVVSPVVAYLNYKLVLSDEFPDSHKPGFVMKIWAWVGMASILVMTLFFFLYL